MSVLTIPFSGQVPRYLRTAEGLALLGLGLSAPLLGGADCDAPDPGPAPAGRGHYYEDTHLSSAPPADLGTAWLSYGVGGLLYQELTSQPPSNTRYTYLGEGGPVEPWQGIPLVIEAELGALVGEVGDLAGGVFIGLASLPDPLDLDAPRHWIGVGLESGTLGGTVPAARWSLPTAEGGVQVGLMGPGVGPLWTLLLSINLDGDGRGAPALFAGSNDEVAQIAGELDMGGADSWPAARAAIADMVPAIITTPHSPLGGGDGPVIRLVRVKISP